ncbi:MAG: PilZ domain-containing protein [Zoogloeaceae bacterium]|jgi:type IV pilus assembly protein PilZ|nr:PilZ domain-containing protein [Zoogloeaceae bacterium]
MNGQTPTPKAGGAKPSLLSLNINSKSALYSAYMPFLKNGGLFIPTTREYAFGDEVFILLTLMDDASRLPITGNVVWITPEGAQGNKAQGVGIQFSSDESGQTVRKKIETILSGHLNSARATHTL